MIYQYVIHTEKKLLQQSYFMFIWRELAVAYKKCGMPYTTGQTHSNTSNNTNNTKSIINVHIQEMTTPG